MIGQLVNDRYRLDAELGRGGMGTVYRAHDTLLERDVAIKVLSNTGLGTEGRARLLREAQAVARLNHPNIVTVYDAGETDGTPFIVMELVAGETLRHIPTPTLAETLTYARQICAALEHAHAHGIIHRDLKPENVIVVNPPSPSKGEGSGVRVKLMDFGLAWSENAPRLTEEGTLLGTFAYLAPELITGGAASPQSDLYALGVMLYELLTGRPPFEGNDLALLLGQHLHAPVTPPRTHNPDISPDVDALVVRLLSKQPDERPGSAAEVLTALGESAPLAPVYRRAPAPIHNLPTQLSTFIGREKEMAQIKRLLGEHRLVTLTGSGGIGKTRLAIQVAAELAGRDDPSGTGDHNPLAGAGGRPYRHGVWLIELAPLARPELVQGAVATVLGVHDSPERPVLDALTDYLREKAALLVLDNCEHVIDACAQLAEHLLQHCPEVRILASSREALGIEGETAVRVPSLSLPPAERAARETLEQSEAVRLFVERAAAARPGFELTDANANAIVQVCRRLDGVALAIELAAARVKLLKVEQIAARLDDAFRLLTGGSRTALPRQQTLRATIDWSYNLLSEAERKLLRRLSVFAGGWTLEAAEATCAGDDVDARDVLELLTQLANKSLVTVEHEQGEAARYRLLETIRQYAHEKLGESSELLAVRDRHLDYFLRLAEEAAPHIEKVEKTWLDRLETEFDNVRAAWEHALAGDAERALRLAEAVNFFRHDRGGFPEQRAWLARLLPLTKAWGVSKGRATALWLAGRSAQMMGDDKSARPLLEAGLAVARTVGDKRTLGITLINLAATRVGTGDRSQERAWLEESLALYRELGDAQGTGRASGALGWEAMQKGDAHMARALFEQALSACRSVDDNTGINLVMRRLGILAYRTGDYTSARTLLEQCLSRAREEGSKWNIEVALLYLGHLARLQGDFARAAAAYAECLQLDDDMLGTRYQLELLISLGYVALHEHDFVRARALFEKGVSRSRQAGDVGNIATGVTGLAGILAATGKPHPAAQSLGWVKATLQTRGEVWNPTEQLEYDRILAAVRAQLDEATFNTAWAQGRAMTIKQAVAYALEETGQ